MSIYETAKSRMAAVAVALAAAFGATACGTTGMLNIPQRDVDNIATVIGGVVGYKATGDAAGGVIGAVVGRGASQHMQMGQNCKITTTSNGRAPTSGTVVGQHRGYQDVRSNCDDIGRSVGVQAPGVAIR